MDKMKRLTGKKILLVAVALCAFGFAKAQDTQAEKNILTLTLDKALEIALDENPTIKVAEEEVALKKVASKEAWQSLLPEASIAGSVDHTIKAAEMKLNDMSFKMGQDGSNTANAGLSINLPLFVPGVYRAMSMTKTDIELAVEKSRASKLDLVNQVSKAYYQLMLAQDSYEVLQGSYKLAEDNYNVVNAKYQQGTVSEYDKILFFRQLTGIFLPVIIQIPIIENKIFFRLLYSGNMSGNCILRCLIALRILDRHAQTRHLHHRNFPFFLDSRGNSRSLRRSRRSRTRRS